MHENPGKIEKEQVERFKTKEDRLEAAQKFIQSLDPPPLHWKLSGSTESGEFEPDSDIDVIALYEKDEDIPYDDIFKRMHPNGLFDGHIDFHYFSKNWGVYQHDPELLKQLEESFED